MGGLANIFGGQPSAGPAAAPPPPAAPAAPAQKAPATPGSGDLNSIFSGTFKPKQKAAHDPGWLGSIVEATKWAADSPVGQGATAILGAPDNAIVGGELAAANKGNIGDIARGAWSGLTQPGQATANVHALEQKMHLPVAGENATLPQRAAQVVEDTLLQSQTAAIPGLDVITGAKWLGKVIQAIPKFHEVSEALVGAGRVAKEAVPGAAAVEAKGPGVLNKIFGAFDPDYSLNKIVTPLGRAFVKAAQSTKIPGEEGAAAFLKPQQIADAIAQNVGGKAFKQGQDATSLTAHLEEAKGAQALDAAARKGNLFQQTLRYASDLQRDALFVLPFAHMKNLTVLAGLGPGGVSTIRKGINYAGKLSKEDPETLARLQTFKDIGGAATYRGEEEGGNKFAQLPGKAGELMKKQTDWSNKVLTNYDNGLRLAVAEKLKSRGMNDEEISSQIRDIMGDYMHPSDFTKTMRGVGANFPAWRMQVVPKAMYKAVREQPKAVQAYSRVQSNISNDITEPTIKTSFNMGGPGEDAAKLAEFPTGTINSLTSGGTIGPVADVFAAKQAMQEGTLGKFAGQEAEKYLPYGTMISKVPGLNPWSDNGNPVVNAALGAFGIYMTNTQSTKAETASMKRKGMKTPDVNAEEIREGKRRNPNDYHDLQSIFQ